MIVHIRAAEHFARVHAANEAAKSGIKLKSRLNDAEPDELSLSFRCLLPCRLCSKLLYLSRSSPRLFIVYLKAASDGRKKAISIPERSR